MDVCGNFKLFQKADNKTFLGALATNPASHLKFSENKFNLKYGWIKKKVHVEISSILLFVIRLNW